MSRRWLVAVALLVAGCAVTAEQVAHNVIPPEQRRIDYRDPAALPPAEVPETPTPRTVTEPRPQTPDWPLSLDEAIRIALENARVVRVLAGTTAVSSGRTIYEPGISNTVIDQEQARFDPTLADTLRFNRIESPSASLDPQVPLRTLVGGFDSDEFNNILGLRKTNVLGGEASLDWTTNTARFGGLGVFPLDPQSRPNIDLRYTQPLLQGGGFLVNAAPIVIARINTERSFYQYKDAVQDLVRGVVEGYWNLVQARVDVWARKIQVQQSEEAYSRDKARLESGLGDLKDVAQARVTYTQFKANLIAAEADALAREGALRNLLGLAPEDNRRIVPVSTPTNQQLVPQWDPLVRLATERRPDIVDLKLVLEVDRQRRIQALNTALPRLDAVGVYRWNGISGTAPNGETVGVPFGRFADWTLGMNLSVPLGRRQGRALVRQQNLLIARDRANVEQSIHAAVHELAATTRDLSNAYEQYKAFRETRAAAIDNLKVQIEQFRAGRSIYLNVLVALNDWGTAVTSEARALLGYNVLLATLERQTGTILETHGLVFYEERFAAPGPLGVVGRERCYPSGIFTAGAPTRWPPGREPSENAFDLVAPQPRDPPATLPPPRPAP